MKSAFIIPLLLAFCVAGCASNVHITTPRISRALIGANLDLPIEDFKAAGDWIPDYGHGLSVQVWAKRNAGDYKRNLDLELEGAAIVCAALAKSDGITDWDFLDIRFFNKYGRISPGSRDVVGVARVIITRHTLDMLRQNNVPASEYPIHWEFINGFKDQPDSKKLLSW